MQRTGLIVALLLALPALAISACGGDDEAPTTGERTTAGERQVGTAPAPAGEVTPSSKPRDAAPGDGESTTPATGAPGDSPAAAPEPAEAPESAGDSGGGSAQFRGRGDNSVQETGAEADRSEFEQAAAVLHGYLDALAAGRWKAACAYMSSEFRASVEQLGGGPCATAIAALAGGPSLAQEAAVADAGALRADGDQGFLLFHGANRRDYFMPMAREGGRWKIAALAASELR